MDLIDQILSGDGEAFAALFHQYKNLVYRTAILITGSAADAEDIVQEVFLRVHGSLRTYDASKGAFTTWLYRIAVNASLGRQRRSRPAMLDVDSIAVSAPSPEAAVADRQALEHALAGLTDRQRAVIFLRYYAGLSYAEMADVLEVPPGTVQSRLNAALQSLRKNLDVPFDPGENPNPDRSLESNAVRSKGGAR